MRTTSVLGILEETVKRYGTRTAIIDGEDRITYEQLTEQAGRLGYALTKALDGAVQKPVMLFMEKGHRCITAMLGVLYSGNIYVPMDVKTPLDRFLSIQQTLKSTCILTTAAEALLLRKTGYEGEVLLYEELLEKQKDHERIQNGQCAVSKLPEKVGVRTVDTDLMYILFTSGSTGAPKGVAVTHRSVIDYIEDFQKEVRIDAEDILGNQTPFYTDMSLKDIYMGVKAGAAVCIIPQQYFMSPKRLLQYLEDKRVTSLAWVPTAYRIVVQFDGLSKVRPQYLRRFLFSGETMPVPVYQYWKGKYPDAEFIQQYGPTEITGACTSFRVTKDYREGETIPIGKPFPNTGLLLLDEEDREIRSSDTERMGEICIYGTCLAAGYYNNPQKTREVFVQNPLVTTHESLLYRTGDLARWDGDGNLIFVSRKDDQIKHGGRRIEPGEIEAAAIAVEEIQACCCVHNVQKDALALYYIGESDERELIRKLQDRLPKYMIPTIFHKREMLPILANGKLNRRLMGEWENG